MIKLIIFDADGTLFSSGFIHIQALNEALETFGSQYCISPQEDMQYLGTLPTKDKLPIISKLKSLPSEYYQEILDLKKVKTLEILKSLPVSDYFDESILGIIEELKKDGYLVYLASNTNRAFIDAILEKTGLVFDKVFSNQDVSNPKPHPEMFLRCFLEAQVTPGETLIFEDSRTGQEAAIKSGANLYGVESPKDLNLSKIKEYIKKIDIYEPPSVWKSQKINVVMPMAGEGSRFKLAGWETPKPLIDIFGLPMFAAVIKDLNLDANFIFIIKEEHNKEYHLSTMIKLAVPNANIFYVSGKQEGAATTILAAKDLIDTDNHLLIVNADQMWDWNANLFYHSTVTNQELDGSIVVFEENSGNPKWSFAKTDKNGWVIEVAEKKAISNLATAGIYYFSKGSDFVHYTEQMISENGRINNEFYVAPVYNYMISDGKKIGTFAIEKFWPTGTPEELAYYLENRVT